MASQMASFCVLSLLVLQISTAIAVDTAPAPGPAKQKANITTPLIIETCQKTPNKDVCIELLSTSTKAAKADLKGLAAIAVEGATKKATSIADHITNLLDTYHPPTLQQCINDCSEGYEDIMEQFTEITDGLDRPDLIDDVDTWMIAAISEIDTCEKACNMQDVEKNVLTQKNAELKNICVVTLAILKLLPGVN